MVTETYQWHKQTRYYVKNPKDQTEFSSARALAQYVGVLISPKLCVEIVAALV